MDPHQQDRVEAAKASLVARAEELGRRLHDVREKLDVSAQIAAHPWIATGAAFALGLVLGAIGGGSGKRRDAADVQRSLGSAFAAGLGALAMTAIKELAMHQVKGFAKQWLGDSEEATSHERDVEAFLEH